MLLGQTFDKNLSKYSTHESEYHADRPITSLTLQLKQ